MTDPRLPDGCTEDDLPQSAKEYSDDALLAQITESLGDLPAPECERLMAELLCDHLYEDEILYDLVMSALYRTEPPASVSNAIESKLMELYRENAEETMSNGD